MQRETISRWLGAALLLVIGAIHLVTAPDQFNDATYKGLLFLPTAAGSAVAAIGIFRSERWGWWLGLVLSISTVAGYVLSRTDGLPGLPRDLAIFEPLGVVSVAAELGFALLVLALRRPSQMPVATEAERARAA